MYLKLAFDGTPTFACEVLFSNSVMSGSSANTHMCYEAAELHVVVLQLIGDIGDLHIVGEN